MFKKMLLILSPFILAACSAKTLEPPAYFIEVTPNPPGKDCVYKGQVFGNQGNFVTGRYTSNQNLQEGAMNDLKNEAVKFNANYVQLLDSQSGSTGRRLRLYNDLQTNVSVTGNAYACPPDQV